jgi:pimeloyl-ACP methyl ester carboxylesterase
MNLKEITRLSRPRFITGVSVLALTGLLLSASQIAQARPVSAVTTLSSSAELGKTVKPTIVLEPGAWADPSSWDAVIALLEHDGYTAYAPPDPLKSLPYDSATLSDFLSSIKGPIVLVGHSYGGMVITNAARGHANVEALVYDDAFIPNKGQTAFGINAAKPGSCVAGNPAAFLNLVHFPGSPAGDMDAYLRVQPGRGYAGFDQCFANGVPAAEAALLAATQEPFAVGAGSDHSGVPAWKTIPSWAIIGTADHVIPPAEQLATARVAGAHITMIDSGHLSLITHPGAVTQVILEAVRAVG